MFLEEGLVVSGSWGGGGRLLMKSLLIRFASFCFVYLCLKDSTLPDNFFGIVVSFFVFFLFSLRGIGSLENK